MFDDYFALSRILGVVDRIPREVTICAAAYCLITDIHKRQSRVKLEQIKAEAQVRTVELEVEKLRLQIELRDRPTDTSV
jgi:hypothetical protein